MGIATRAGNRLIYIFRYGWWRMAKFLRESVIIKTRYGRFKVLLSDLVIGLNLVLTRQYDTKKLFDTLTFLRDTGYINKKLPITMLDIGANNGVIGIQALNMHLVHNVIAIEPEPRNFSLLQENVALNCLGSKMSIYQCAVAETVTEVEFELDKHNSGDHRVRTSTSSSSSSTRNQYQEETREVIKVQANQLDRIIESDAEIENIQFCWMDIQGFEGAAIRSGAKTFSKGIPTMLEVWPYGMKRSGFSQEEFLVEVEKHWSHFFRFESETRREYPVGKLAELFLELKDQGNFEDILLIKK